MRFLRRRRGAERGAALVEFAVLAPLLIILVLGIVEFGWLFGQYNDVRHGAREGARFAAVNAGDNTQIRDTVCGSMDGLSAGMTSITIDLARTGQDRGETGTITVSVEVSTLSGLPLISQFLPSNLTSSIEFRLERAGTSWGGGTEQCT
jgi:Flp pilus assembly protein TadG